MSAPTKILIIDDEDDIRLSFSAFLEDSGFDTRQAANGLLGLAEFKVYQPDLVLTDLRMPHADGITVVDTLKKTSPDIPVIVITGTGLIGDAVEAVRSGAWDILTKPVQDLGVLELAVNKCLERSRLIVENREFRKRLEDVVMAQSETILDQQAEVEVMVNAAPVGICSLDNRLNIRRVNRAMLSLFGKEDLEVSGKQIDELAGAEMLPPEVKEVLKSHPNHPLTREWKRGERSYWAHLAPIPGSKGHCAGYGLVVEDVTERVKAEQQEAHLQKVEAMGRLASGVAHDFNNILQAMYGFIQLGRDAATIQDAQPYLDRAEKVVERAVGLTKQILTLSRRRDTSRETVDLNEVVEEVGIIMRETFDRRVVCSIQKMQGLPPIIADSSQLASAILNLCINAKDAIIEKLEKEGCAGDGAARRSEITVRTRTACVSELDLTVDPDAKLGEYSVVEIQDSGCGMPPHVMARIFEPFFTTKAEGKGTGLGLAMALGTVKKVEGWIGISSVVDEGTTFTLHFPIQRDISAPVPEKKSAPSKAPIGGVVLLADDEEAIRSIGTVALQRLGVRVVTAADGQETLDLLEKEEGELKCVVLDMTMPKVSGDEIVKIMRTRYPRLPIVMSSGLPQVIAGDATGIYFLQKPYSIPDLADMVRQAVTAVR